MKPVSDYKIYCDMDGVLADFMGAITHWFYQDRDWNELKRDHDINTKRWTESFRAKVKTKPDFWDTLPLMPGSRQLWSKIKPYNPFILSAYAEWDKENSRRGKIAWAARHFRISENRMLLVRREEKVRYASPNSILIDDYIKNIREWEDAGGIGIHHTSAAKTVSELAKYGIK